MTLISSEHFPLTVDQLGEHIDHVATFHTRIGLPSLADVSFLELASQDDVDPSVYLKAVSA